LATMYLEVKVGLRLSGQHLQYEVSVDVVRRPISRMWWIYPSNPSVDLGSRFASFQTDEGDLARESESGVCIIDYGVLPTYLVTYLINSQ
jgi:hypothetical protein